MRSYFFRTVSVAVLLILAGITSAWGQTNFKCEGNGLKESEAKDVLKFHNGSRSGSDLTYDCSLAAKAQAAADAAATGSSAALGAGESRISSHDGGAAVKAFLDIWRDEKVDWDAKTSKCEDGHVCTHWAQIVAPTTTRVGCGVNRKGTGSSKTIFVCVYDPPRS